MSARGASVPLYQQIDDLKARVVSLEEAVGHLLQWYNELEGVAEEELSKEEEYFKDSEESSCSTQPYEE